VAQTEFWKRSSRRLLFTVPNGLLDFCNIGYLAGGLGALT